MDSHTIMKKEEVKRYYTTYFDRNYIIKGIALIESLKANEKNSFELFVICLDELTCILLKQMNYSFVSLIPLHAIERNDTDLIKAKGNRTLIEYYWTLTPTIILNILENNKSVHSLIYIDADIFFYASPDVIWNELGNNSAMIHEHRFSPEQKYLERNGKYNVGLLCFKNDNYSKEILNWWRKSCNEWCYYRLEDGKFGDQLYLNQFPTRFKGVTVLENIGAGVAPWNHIQYQFTIDNEGKRRVDKVPLIFYHFHSLEILMPEIIIPSKFFPVTPFTEDIINICFEPYANFLFKGFKKIQSIFPNFSSGFIKNYKMTEKQLFLVHESIQSKIIINNMFFDIMPLKQGWVLYTSTKLRDNIKHDNKQTELKKLIKVVRD